jgi:glycogen debranching enzyme
VADVPSTIPIGELRSLEDTVVIKEGNLFAVTMPDGSVPIEGPHPLGFYWCDCRFLSGHELRLSGARPRLLIASDELGSAAVHELTNPDVALDGGSGVLRAQSVEVRLERALTGGPVLRELITVQSYHVEPVELSLELRLRADFRPMMEIRGIVQMAERPPPDIEATEDGVALHRVGADGVERRTVVTASPAPQVIDGSALRFDLALSARQPHDIELEYALLDDAVTDRAPRRPRAGGVAVKSNDRLFDRIVRRSLRDLSLLRSELDGRRYYAAGIPWYAALFGRDSLIAATEMIAFDAGMAAETLRLLAGLLGQRTDDERDEEPGKVIHELRVGEIARVGRSPFARYYGTVDATPLFLCLLCDHADWSGTLDLFRELRGEVDQAVEWMDRHADLDGDGLLEYRRRSQDGLRNQGWKDSPDGVIDERGTPLEPPIALVEAQAYAVRAKRRLAALLELDGEGDRAERLRGEAAELADRIDRFWLEDERFYSMALDGEKRASRARASNQGHLLWAGAVPPDRARAVRDALMDDAGFSGWGIRTLAAGEAAYNPLGYHTGSVWPHDNAMIAHGFRRYGFDEDFTSIFEAMLEAASQFGDYRLPELFAGFPRAEYERPVPYPVACHPQAWAAAAIPSMLRSGLGLSAEGLDGRLRILRPSLPGWLSHVEVRALTVAGATIDLSFERTDDRVTLSDARVDGDVDIAVE